MDGCSRTVTERRARVWTRHRPARRERSPFDPRPPLCTSPSQTRTRSGVDGRPLTPRIAQRILWARSALFNQCHNSNSYCGIRTMPTQSRNRCSQRICTCLPSLCAEPRGAEILPATPLHTPRRTPLCLQCNTKDHKEIV